MNEKFEKLVNTVKENPGKAIAIGVGAAIVAVVAVKAIQYVSSQPELLNEVAEAVDYI